MAAAYVTGVVAYSIGLNLNVLISPSTMRDKLACLKGRGISSDGGKYRNLFPLE